MAIILPRQYGYGYGGGYGYGYGDGYYSPWSSYGRWIVLGAVILGAFLLFVIFSCITARRRKRAGLNPYRGTGWLGGPTPVGHGPAQFTGGPAQQPYFHNQSTNVYGTEQHQSPPVYSPQAQNTYGGANQGYFGGQQSGIELQQPNNAYQPQRGGEPVYDAPQGAPPNKKFGDGIIR